MQNWSLNEEDQSVHSILHGENSTVLQDVADSSDGHNEKDVFAYLEENGGYAWCTEILRDVGNPRKVEVALNNLYEGGLVDSESREEGLLIYSRDLDGMDPKEPDLVENPVYNRWSGEVFNP